MYQWSTLRSFAGVVLCIPLLHLALLVSTGVRDYLDPSPEVWDDEMEALIASDLKAAIPQRPVVVIGGQRVRLWKELPARLAPQPTLMRPLGDATLDDLIYHFDRLVAFYRPRMLIVFPGYADLHIRDSKSPDEFRTRLEELLELDSGFGSTNWRYVIAPLQMPLHPADFERVSKMVAESRKLEKRLSHLTVIDPNPILADSEGRPNPAFFRGDGINLNPEGYARISLLLESAMDTEKQLGGPK